MKVIIAALFALSTLTAFAASEECSLSIQKVMQKSVSYGVTDQIVRENPEHEQAAKSLEKTAQEVREAFEASIKSCN